MDKLVNEAYWGGAIAETTRGGELPARAGEPVVSKRWIRGDETGANRSFGNGG
jgi:hypothetical protein